MTPSGGMAMNRSPEDTAGANGKKAGAAAGLILVAGAALQPASPWILDYLERWESGGNRVLVAYADTLAGGLPTVCNGLTRWVTDTPIVVGAYWPAEKCEAEEAAAVARVQQRLASCFQRTPTQRVFDVATSHAWNFGVGATCGSQAMVAWNAGQWALGCQRLSKSDAGKPVWSYACTTLDRERRCTFVRGLAARRADESAQCEAGS